MKMIFPIEYIYKKKKKNIHETLCGTTINLKIEHISIQQCAKSSRPRKMTSKMVVEWTIICLCGPSPLFALQKNKTVGFFCIPKEWAAALLS